MKRVKITLVADFDPFQGGSRAADPDIYTMQFMHKNGLDENGNKRKSDDGNGWLANQKEQGADFFQEDKNDATHAISSFLEDIKRLKEGTYTWDQENKTWVCQSCDNNKSDKK